jgi:hypothetical protein
MTQKQDVWYEVLQADETSLAAASSSGRNSSSSSSKDAFWVEHRRSPQESRQFRQQQKAHSPPVKQQTRVEGALTAVGAGKAGSDALVKGARHAGVLVLHDRQHGSSLPAAQSLASVQLGDT